jgi:hypothetical protein
MPLTVEHGLAAIAVAKSNNEKIGDCATTYAAQASCPSSCAFFNGGGCYAENGRLYSGVTRPLNLVAAAAGLTPADVAPRKPPRSTRSRSCPAGRCGCTRSATAAPTRPRGSSPRQRSGTWTPAADPSGRTRTPGGSSTAQLGPRLGARLVRDAGAGRARPGARLRAAIVVDEFDDHRLYEPCRTASVSRHDPDGDTGSPLTDGVTGQRPRSGARVTSAAFSPARRRRATTSTCSSCRLCMDDGGLLERGYSIGFEVHGTASSVKAARKALAGAVGFGAAAHVP